jgi:hypothetical protein
MLTKVETCFSLALVQSLASSLIYATIRVVLFSCPRNTLAFPSRHTTRSEHVKGFSCGAAVPCTLLRTRLNPLDGYSNTVAAES